MHHYYQRVCVPTYMRSGMHGNSIGPRPLLSCQFWMDVGGRVCTGMQVKGGWCRRAARDASWVDGSMHEGAGLTGLAGQLGPKGSDRVFACILPKRPALNFYGWLDPYYGFWLDLDIFVCFCFYSLSTGPRGTTSGKLYFESTSTFIRLFLFSVAIIPTII
jgi:hypothetical protein